MTSLRGGAAPEASSAVAGSGGMAVSSVSRARWSRASATAWATAASASGEPSTATRMLRYTLDIVRPSTMIGAVQDDPRWKVRVRDQSPAATRAAVAKTPENAATVLHNLPTVNGGPGAASPVSSGEGGQVAGRDRSIGRPPAADAARASARRPARGLAPARRRARDGPGAPGEAAGARGDHRLRAGARPGPDGLSGDGVRLAGDRPGPARRRRPRAAPGAPGAGGARRDRRARPAVPRGGARQRPPAGRDQRHAEQGRGAALAERDVDNPAGPLPRGAADLRGRGRLIHRAQTQDHRRRGVRPRPAPLAAAGYAARRPSPPVRLAGPGTVSTRCRPSSSPARPTASAGTWPATSLKTAGRCCCTAARASA